MISKQTLYTLAQRLVAPMFTPIYGGMASILMFHRVLEPKPGIHPGWLRAIEIEPDLIARLVERLRRTGHEIVSLDELHETLVKRRKPRAKLVTMTFDDGYVDAYTTIHPLLTSYDVPFTVYLTTDFPDRRIAPWWYLLDERLSRSKTLEVRIHGRDISCPVATPRQVDAAFARVGALLDAGTPADRWALAAEVFGADEVARAMEALFLSWDQVSALAAHPLVTIGAHTVSHAPLKLLSLEEARWEMVESRSRIEARIGKPVRHFAYPYGFPSLVGAREYALARECGFATAVTTRTANLFPASASSLECLPRVRGTSLAQIEVSMAGLPAALRYPGRRVVTV
ncbi:MAG: polysaccharide deacetylase family protein [Byssovorax sp.]